MATPRSNPFIWVTWLAKAMSGDSACLWGAWFQVHNKLDAKQPSEFDLVGWQVDHARMLTELIRELKKPGRFVNREQRISLQLPLNGATISGTADCVVYENQSIHVYDCKTGKDRPSDQIQVMTYLYMLGQTPVHAGKSIAGTVVYSDHRVSVPGLPGGFESNLEYFVNLLAGPTAPPREPGLDCRFCNLTSFDCPDRQ